MGFAGLPRTRSAGGTRFEDQVGLVCAKALDLPPAEGRLMRGDLMALLARTEALSVALLHARQMSNCQISN